MLYRQSYLEILHRQRLVDLVHHTDHMVTFRLHFLSLHRPFAIATIYFFNMKTLSLPTLVLPMLLPLSIKAGLPDIPLFYDYYCLAQDDNESFWQKNSSWYIKGIDISFNCAEKFEGTSSVDVLVANDVTNSYDFLMKFSTDRQHAPKDYKDIRFMVKNLNGTAEKVRVAMEANIGNNTIKPFSALDVDIPAANEWTEVVVAFSDFQLIDYGATTSSGNYSTSYPISGIGFRHTWPDNKTGSALHLLIDQIRITDGTEHEADGFAKIPGGLPPESWPSSLMVGTLDARANSAISDNSVPKAGTYRYEYIMPESFTDWGDSKYAQTYAEKSALLGQKSGFVWYNLGKVSESAVASNLASASFMTDYFNRYEEFLTQLVDANQSDYIIVLEPDMYGRLIQLDKLPNFDCSETTVNMDRANQITGTTYSANLCGWAQYVVGRAHSRLAKGVIIGHMLNPWGANIPGQVGRGRVEAHIISAREQAKLIQSFGSGKGDVIFTEKSDRDAGTETEANWFWNDASYERYFGWTRTLSQFSGLRIVGWQVSQGNMKHSNTANRDNAAQYFVDHPDQWAKGGFIGVLFGAGEAGQANYSGSPKGDDNDGGWFKSTMTAYMQNPYSLSNVTSPIHAAPIYANDKSVVESSHGIIRNISQQVVNIYLPNGKKVVSLSPGSYWKTKSGLYFWKNSTMTGSIIVNWTQSSGQW